MTVFRAILIAAMLVAPLLAATSRPAAAVTVQWRFSATYEDNSRVSGRFRYNSVAGTFSNLRLVYRRNTLFDLPRRSVFNVIDPVSTDFVLFALPQRTDLSDLTGVPYIEIDVNDFGDVSSVLEFTAVTGCENTDCTLYGTPNVLATTATLTGRIRDRRRAAAAAIPLTGAPVAPVPLPASGVLLAAALGGIALLGRRGADRSGPTSRHA